MRGDVTVRAECLMPEKLLARVAAQGVPLSAVRRPDARTLEIVCDSRGAKSVLGLCARFSIPARIVSRRGRSAVAQYVRKRITLWAGIAACLALCAVFLGRVWLIDVAFTGENAGLGRKEALLKQLDALRVRPGMLRGIDTAALGQSLQAAAPDYSYVGARLQGVRLLIEAAPEAPAPALYDVDAARDLVSSRDGIVVRAIARSGELCVSPGDAVRRGQLLIRGEEKQSGDENRPIAALGEVVVRAWFEGEAALPLQEPRTAFTGRTRTASALSVFGQEWTLTQAEPFSEQVETTEHLPVGGLFVPLEIRRQTWRETRTTPVDADIGALENRLSALALADAARAFQPGDGVYDIADSWVSYRVEGDALRARAVYEIHADAAVTREALLQGGN